jgi:hypothetical protein
MGQYMSAIMESMGAIEKGKGSQPVFESTVSDGAILRLADAMVYSPRSESLLEKIGVEDAEEFKAKIVPALKTILKGMGIGVSNAAAAKRDVKDMAK